MESVFTFLFKYRPLLYQEGRLVLQPPVPWPLLLVLLLGAAALVAWAYRRPLGRAAGRDRTALAALRALALAILLLCLLRPTLVLSSVLPQQNYVGILIDDSRSMRIADDGRTPRTDAVARALAAPDAALVRALEERFQLRWFGFSGDVARVVSPADLTYAGGRTLIGPALSHVREELGALPLSGVVLVTDGADASAEADADGVSALSASLLALRAAGVPVYTVGVGRESHERDVELSRVTAPREALRGSSIMVDLVIAQTGYGTDQVDVIIEDDGRIIGSETVRLPRAGEPAPVRVEFTPQDEGVRRITFRVAPLEDELIARNNEQEVLVNVRGGPQKILYFEGEPRFEVAFLRRALAADSSIQLVTLQRTADNKFMRLDVDSAGELVTGFPTTREELFTYRALVLGSIEASHFTHEQLRMISDFVSERGGGLLMLGGIRSLAEGGYAGTPVADALPVTLDPRFTRDALFFDTLAVSLTAAGAAQPALRLADDDRASTERWRTLPELTTYNRVGALKPGAQALLTGTGRRSGADRPVLAWQRFGRGQSFALPVQDTWIWQMHADIPVEDESHERFWRQMMRWLVTSVPEPVVATAVSDHVAPGEAVRLVADVSDRRFTRTNGSTVVARVTAPDGTTSDVPMEWTPGRNGEYRAGFSTREPGMYRVDVTAGGGDAALDAQPVYVHAAEPRDEYFGTQMRAPLLRRIAQETGGRFYTIDDAGTLAEDIALTGRGASVQEEREVWDAPIVFLLLVAVLGAEWACRRARGLA